MTPEELNRAYVQTYSIDNDEQRKTRLQELRRLAEQPGLADWVRLIDSRLPLFENQYDMAIERSTAIVVEAAVAPPVRHWARLNRGVAYGQKGDTERAIADYTAVIDDPAAPAEQKTMAHFSRGMTYGQKSDPEAAIADYTAVIDDPAAPAEQKTMAHFNRGLAYGQKGDPERAIADYAAVIDDPAAPAEQKAKARFSRGVTYGRKGDPERAIADYAAMIDDPAAAAFLIEGARIRLKMIKNQSAAGRESASDIAIDLEPEIKALFRKELEAGRKRKREFFDESHFDPDASFLLVAREWNSFTPAVPDEGEPARGGGYFFRHRGVGVVIDPGFDFLEIFAESGGRLRDIDHVVITHAHNDHTAELEPILTLLHEHNHPREGEPERPRRQIKLYLSHGAARKFAGLIPMRDCDYLEEVVTLNRGSKDHAQVVQLSPYIRLTVLPAYHDDVITKDYAVGVAFELDLPCDNVRRLLFTGDTALYRNDEEGKPISQEIFELYPEPFRSTPCDLVVAHIGSIENFELEERIGTMAFETKKIQLERTYDKHLALRGTLVLLYSLRPKAAIVSEFGEEMKSIWIKAVRAIDRQLSELLGDAAFRVFAGDPTLVYDIANGQFLCHEDLQFHAPKDLRMMGVHEIRAGNRAGPVRPYLFLNQEARSWEDESDWEDRVRAFHDAVANRTLPHFREKRIPGVNS